MAEKKIPDRYINNPVASVSGQTGKILSNNGTSTNWLALGSLNIQAASGTGGTNISSSDTTIGTVSITPNLSTSTIVIDCSAEFTKDTGTTARTVVFKLKNNAGTVLGQRTVTSAGTASIVFSGGGIPAIDTPGSTSAQTYTLTASCATGTPITGRWNIVVYETSPAGATGSTGSTGATGPAQGITVNQQTGTTYTLQASDNGKIIECTNSSAVTITIPSGLGTTFGCTISQVGTGQVTLSAGAGVTLHNRQSLTKSAGQWSAYSVYPTNTSNVYVTQGDMA